MEVIAQCGDRVLVQLEERDPERPLKLLLGCIVDMRLGKVSRSRGLDTLLAHGNGYWHPFEGDSEPVLALVHNSLDASS